MEEAVLAATEIILILIGVSNFTGYIVNKGTANRAWALIDLANTVLSTLIIVNTWGTPDPCLQGVKWVLGATTIGAGILHIAGARATSPIWKYIDGMNLSLLTVVVLSGVFNVIDGLYRTSA